MLEDSTTGISTISVSQLKFQKEKLKRHNCSNGRNKQTNKQKTPASNQCLDVFQDGRWKIQEVEFQRCSFTAEFPKKTDDKRSIH